MLIAYGRTGITSVWLGAGCGKIGLMKIALVHDDLIQRGGAERLFEAMVETFSDVDIYTSIATAEYDLRFTDYDLRTSFMQKLPFKEKLYRHYFPLYPLAFESFDLSEYDLVISSTTRFAHGVITRPETLHICYMNTPPRMFWEPKVYFENFPYPFKSFLNPFLSYFRLWDYAAAQRVDYFIANAKTPQARIKKYYGRDSKIIYPFVDLERFQNNSEKLRESEKSEYSENQIVGESGNQTSQTLRNSGSLGVSDNPTLRPTEFSEFSEYFLVVSRLTSWKRIDIAIEACNQLKLPLKIIGEGSDRSRLEKLAGPTVELLGRLTDDEVVRYYKNCRALIFPQKEDFGITPLEAQAAGKPVIAYGAGGALETVIEGKTGEFFHPQTADALVKVLKNFGPEKYQKEDRRQQAEKFSKKRFQGELKNIVEEVYEKHLSSF